MEIHEIKASIPLSEVLTSYNLQPNKNNMLRCPFHEDSTASLQVSFSQNKYKCHGCDKKGDVIQFVQDYEKLTKHEALKKCTEMIETIQPVQKAITTIQTPNPVNEKERILFLEKMFLSFRKGLLSSPPAKEYCSSRNLDFDKLEVGFNSGQFHHGARKDEKLINDALQCGLLTTAGTNSRTGGQAYKPFGNKSILFPLRNKENQIVSFYFRSTINNENSKHFYLKNRQGLYPNYPNPDTKKLLLTEAIIDTASLLQIDEIKDNYTLLTCYGTNGLNEEILNALKPLKQLEEIIEGKKNEVSYKGRYIQITTKNKANVEKLLTDWYKLKAKEKFEEIASPLIEKFQKYDVSPSGIYVQNMKTRWGSCTPKGKIILNPELIKTPKGCIEYVIIHELCHLVHHGHNQKFFELQAKECPLWERWKKKLEQFG